MRMPHWVANHTGLAFADDFTGLTEKGCAKPAIILDAVI